MKVLIINKFLYPNGGSETYIFKLGEYLQSQNHEVQYFGMEHVGRCVGNTVNAYTSNKEFHGGSKLSKLTYPITTIYSSEARKKIRLVLDDFNPNVCHINNFNYQLTPSIILEIVKWRKESGMQCKIVFTAHDYQLICPNHMLNNPNTHENCEKCLSGHFINCIKGRCIHGSLAKSVVGTIEAEFWKLNGVYKYIDTIICCSEFLKKKMDSNPLFAEKTVAIHNFVDRVEWEDAIKKDYVLYFGRFSEEKGISTLIRVCKELPEVQFVFAGAGPLADSINGISNIKNVGFQSGESLKILIREARFSIYPSEWYENCPFSVMESQLFGTPVLGADIGGIPELIDQGVTGELFTSRDHVQLKRAIKMLWNSPEILANMKENCKSQKFDNVNDYCEKLTKIYCGGGYNLVVYNVPRYVLYFGRYTEEKGISTLLKAAADLKDILFVCAGKGPKEEDLFRYKTKNVCNIGFKSGLELKKLIAFAQFVVVPSEWYEPFGLTIIEAMQLGKPVIGSNTGGIPELIVNGENGFIFEAGNKTELVEKILLLWNSPNEIKRLSVNSVKLKTVFLNEYGNRLVNELYV